MTMDEDRTRKFKSARALGRAAATGRFLRTGCFYNLTDEDDELVAVVDTSREHGPASRDTVWVIHVQPGHPWSVEVAEEVWWSLGWDEITEDTEDPETIDVATKGWWCYQKVVIEY